MSSLLLLFFSVPLIYIFFQSCLAFCTPLHATLFLTDDTIHITEPHWCHWMEMKMIDTTTQNLLPWQKHYALFIVVFERQRERMSIGYENTWTMHVCKTSNAQHIREHISVIPFRIEVYALAFCFHCNTLWCVHIRSKFAVCCATAKSNDRIMLQIPKWKILNLPSRYSRQALSSTNEENFIIMCSSAEYDGCTGW